MHVAMVLLDGLKKSSDPNRKYYKIIRRNVSTQTHLLSFFAAAFLDCQGYRLVTAASGTR